MAPELRAKKPAAVAAAKPAKAKASKRKAPDDSSPVAPKKAKSVKPDAIKKKVKATEPDVTEKKIKKVSKASAKLENVVEDTTVVTTKKVTEEIPVKEGSPFSDANEAEDEDEDQVLALAGVTESDDEDAVVDSSAGFQKDQDVGTAPKPSKAVKKAAKAGKGEKEEPGVVYIGRVPHGFFEHQMRQYFEQFGTINKLRLSRNKKTGAMKHYGFIEFAESSTAEIVAKTMDNYLLFGHILKVKLVPKSQIHDSLWKGANKRFRAKPHNKIEGSNLKKPRSEAKWEVSISKEYKKRAVRAQKLKKMGYEFEAPELKAVVHAPGEAMTLEEGDEAPKTIEVAPEATSAEAKVPFSADEELGDGIESMDDDTVVTTAKKMTKEDGKGGKKVKKFSKVKKTKKTKKVKA